MSTGVLETSLDTGTGAGGADAVVGVRCMDGVSGGVVVFSFFC